MAITISANNIKIGGDTSGLIASLRGASAAVDSFTRDISLKVTAAYREASKEQRLFNSGLNRLGDDLLKFGKRLSLFGAAPTLFAAGKAYKDFADLEMLQRGVERYGSSLSEIRKLATEAGVGVFEAGKQVISLRASRMEMDLVTRSIKAFSNAIADAGGSASDLGPALVNLSQFLATRHINQIDLRQLSNRMPQTMDVLLNTFGTVDPKELNKVPIEEFIEGLVSGLEKIPPVAAGAKITMEQFVDTIRVTSGTIGEAIEKSFNISDNIKLLGDAINNLTDHFRALSPEAKKSILAVGSLAVIIPSLTLAIGGLVKLVPIIVTGFGLISGSAVAVVAAVGVATAAIITNWDKVKKFLQDSGFWNNMVTVARSALNVIVEVVKLGLNLIQGDWVNFGNALTNILKNVWNGIVSVFGAGLKAFNNLLSSFLNTITGADFVRSLGLTPLFSFDPSSGNSALDALVNKLKFDVPDATDKVREGFKGWSEEIKKVLKGSSGGDEGVEGLNVELERMTKNQYQLWRIELASKHLKEAEAVKRAVEEYKRLAGAIAGVKAEMISNPNTDQGVFAQASRDRRMAWRGEVKLPSGTSKDLYSTLVDSDFNPEAIAKLVSAIPRKVGESLEDYKDRLQEWKEASVQAGRAITAAFRSAASDSFEAMGELLGNLMTGVGGLESFALKLSGVLSNLLKNLGKSLISFGTAGIAMKAFIKNPFTAIAAGVGLIALSTALNNNIQEQMKSTQSVKLAKGGAVYGETLAVVGDNRNARFDPELVAPASHVRKHIHDAISEYGGGRSVRVEGEFEVKGENLWLVLDRYDRRRKSFGGRA